MYPFDELDISVLEELEKNARQSVATLAMRINSPNSTVRDRIKRMQRAGVIRGYTVLLDHEQLGFPIKAVVRTSRDQSVPIRTFISEAIKLPEIASVQLLTGETDELITIYVRNVRHLRDFLYGRIMKLPGVLRTNTVIVLSEIDPPFLRLALSDPPIPAVHFDEFDFEAESASG